MESFKIRNQIQVQMKSRNLFFSFKALDFRQQHTLLCLSIKSR